MKLAIYIFGLILTVGVFFGVQYLEGIGFWHVEYAHSALASALIFLSIYTAFVAIEAEDTVISVPMTLLLFGVLYVLFQQVPSDEMSFIESMQSANAWTQKGLLACTIGYGFVPGGLLGWPLGKIAGDA